MGHKCKEKNIFMAISKDISEDEGDVSPPNHFPRKMITVHPLIKLR
jgi:hypothetical protein